MLLVGDIGGTKTDLAVVGPEQDPRHPLARKRYPSGAYTSLEAIALEFLAEVRLPVSRACFGVAGPVVGGRSTLTNLPWVVDERALQDALSLDAVLLINDVQAMAAAVPSLRPGEMRVVNAGEPVPGGAIAVIAAGTGLGEAFLTWDGARYRAHPSEGSHNDFGPRDALEEDLLRYLQARWGRVSYERVCAGRSIPDLYAFLKAEGHLSESPALAAEIAAVSDATPPIIAAALDPEQPDPLSRAAVNICISALGAEAGNLALTVLATGGVYIAGGIAQRILPDAPGAGDLLLSAFHTKGRLSPLLSRVPVRIILEPVALLGAACMLLEDTPTTYQYDSP
jgi:glucokinase